MSDIPPYSRKYDVWHIEDLPLADLDNGMSTILTFETDEGEERTKAQINSNGYLVKLTREGKFISKNGWHQAKY